ncbi:unnamed protein product [Amoebophrya sp. A120]|nr:unnamed protein product [Amoebophrya sp. A120]|eukprot:GSA120T00025561001.1
MIGMIGPPAAAANTSATSSSRAASKESQAQVVESSNKDENEKKAAGANKIVEEDQDHAASKDKEMKDQQLLIWKNELLLDEKDKQLKQTATELDKVKQDLAKAKQSSESLQEKLDNLQTSHQQQIKTIHETKRREFDERLKRVEKKVCAEFEAKLVLHEEKEKSLENTLKAKQVEFATVVTLYQQKQHPSQVQDVQDFQSKISNATLHLESEIEELKKEKSSRDEKEQKVLYEYRMKIIELEQENARINHLAEEKQFLEEDLRKEVEELALELETKKQNEKELFSKTAYFAIDEKIKDYKKQMELDKEEFEKKLADENSAKNSLLELKCSELQLQNDKLLCEKEILTGEVMNLRLLVDADPGNDSPILMIGSTSDLDTAGGVPLFRRSVAETVDSAMSPAGSDRFLGGAEGNNKTPIHFHDPGAARMTATGAPMTTGSKLVDLAGGVGAASSDDEELIVDESTATSAGGGGPTPQSLGATTTGAAAADTVEQNYAAEGRETKDRVKDHDEDHDLPSTMKNNLSKSSKAPSSLDRSIAELGLQDSPLASPEDESLEKAKGKSDHQGASSSSGASTSSPSGPRAKGLLPPDEKENDSSNKSIKNDNAASTWSRTPPQTVTGGPPDPDNGTGAPAGGASSIAKTPLLVINDELDALLSGKTNNLLQQNPHSPNAVLMREEEDGISPAKEQDGKITAQDRDQSHNSKNSSKNNSSGNDVRTRTSNSKSKLKALRDQSKFAFEEMMKRMTEVRAESDRKVKEAQDKLEVQTKSLMGKVSHLEEQRDVLQVRNQTVEEELKQMIATNTTNSIELKNLQNLFNAQKQEADEYRRKAGIMSLTATLTACSYPICHNDTIKQTTFQELRIQLLQKKIASLQNKKQREEEDDQKQALLFKACKAELKQLGYDISGKLPLVLLDEDDGSSTTASSPTNASGLMSGQTLFPDEEPASASNETEDEADKVGDASRYRLDDTGLEAVEEMLKFDQMGINSRSVFISTLADPPPPSPSAQLMDDDDTEKGLNSTSSPRGIDHASSSSQQVSKPSFLDTVLKLGTDTAGDCNFIATEIAETLSAMKIGVSEIPTILFPLEYKRSKKFRLFQKGMLKSVLYLEKSSSFLLDLTVRIARCLEESGKFLGLQKLCRFVEDYCYRSVFTFGKRERSRFSEFAKEEFARKYEDALQLADEEGNNAYELKKKVKELEEKIQEMARKEVEQQKNLSSAVSASSMPGPTSSQQDLASTNLPNTSTTPAGPGPPRSSKGAGGGPGKNKGSTTTPKPFMSLKELHEKLNQVEAEAVQEANSPQKVELIGEGQLVYLEQANSEATASTSALQDSSAQLQGPSAQLQDPSSATAPVNTKGAKATVVVPGIKGKGKKAAPPPVPGSVAPVATFSGTKGNGDDDVVSANSSTTSGAPPGKGGKAAPPPVPGSSSGQAAVPPAPKGAAPPAPVLAKGAPPPVPGGKVGGALPIPGGKGAAPPPIPAGTNKGGAAPPPPAPGKGAAPPAKGGAGAPPPAKGAAAPPGKGAAAPPGGLKGAAAPGKGGVKAAAGGKGKGKNQPQIDIPLHDVPEPPKEHVAKALHWQKLIPKQYENSIFARLTLLKENKKPPPPGGDQLLHHPEDIIQPAGRTPSSPSSGPIVKNKTAVAGTPLPSSSALASPPPSSQKLMLKSSHNLTTAAGGATASSSTRPNTNFAKVLQNLGKNCRLQKIQQHFFQKPVAKTTAGGGNKDGAPGGGGAAGGKKEKKLTTLLEDGGKAQNIEIALKSRSITAEQVRKRLDDYDLKSMNFESLQIVISMYPTTEEIQQLRRYDELLAAQEKDDPNNPLPPLRGAEDFLMGILKIQHFKQKTDCVSYVELFPKSFEETEKEAGLLESCSVKILNSQALQVVFFLIMQIGNFLNYGTAKGSAFGFSLDTLDKFGQTASFSAKDYTLAHALCEELWNESRDSLKQFLEDLKECEVAGRVDFADCKKRAKDLEQQVEYVRKTVGVKLPDEDAADGSTTVAEGKPTSTTATITPLFGSAFTKGMEEFVINEKKRVTNLTKKIEKLEKKQTELVSFLAARNGTALQDCFSTLAKFRKLIEQSMRQNQERILKERKRQQREEDARKRIADKLMSAVGKEKEKEKQAETTAPVGPKTVEEFCNVEGKAKILNGQNNDPAGTTPETTGAGAEKEQKKKTTSTSGGALDLCELSFGAYQGEPDTAAAAAGKKQQQKKPPDKPASSTSSPEGPKATASEDQAAAATIESSKSEAARTTCPAEVGAQSQSEAVSNNEVDPASTTSTSLDKSKSAPAAPEVVKLKPTNHPHPKSREPPDGAPPEDSPSLTKSQIRKASSTIVVGGERKRVSTLLRTSRTSNQYSSSSSEEEREDVSSPVT